MSGIILAIHGHTQTLNPWVVSSAGGNYASSSATLSFTLAEMTMVQTFSSAGNILTQGFQQPEEGSVGISQSEISSNRFLIYPNPTSGAFTLEFNSENENTVLVKLFNLIGQEEIANTYLSPAGINKISFDISHLSPGMYMLEINTKSVIGNSIPIIIKINLVY